jgi:hypothetical protein
MAFVAKKMVQGAVSAKRVSGFIHPSEAREAGASATATNKVKWQSLEKQIE